MRTNDNNPYVGLRPFEVDESILFFGRKEQTTELLQRLHQHHFVAVVGSSGSGKSSLLRAGLIPALKAGFLVDDSDHWVIAIMKPGQNPLYNLAETIFQQINAETDPVQVKLFLKQIQEEGADVLINILKPLYEKQNTNFFLLVDQFEELFRFAMEHGDADKKDEAIDFVNIILELAQQTVIPFYVVLTMRTDFIGDCVQFNGLPEAMNQSQYLVPRMNRVQLKAVIEGPAKLYGGKMDASLTSKLLNELGKVKDELPLLQHALMRMWDFEINVNKSGALDLLDYQSIGGLENVLSFHADEALVGMTDEELLITKEMFQALTTIDENGRKIRRPVLLSQLKDLTGATEEQLLHIINLFIKDRRSFLIINTSNDTNDKVIDISHESLIRQWNTLNQWVNQETDAARIYKRLSEATLLHKTGEKDFINGTELQIAINWLAKFKPKANWASRYNDFFNDAIDYLEKSKINDEKEKHDKLEAKRIADESEIQKKNLKRTRRISFVISCLGGLALLAMVVSIFLWYDADLNRKEAIKSKELAETSRIEALKSKAAAESNLIEAVRSKEEADSSRLEAIKSKEAAELSRSEAIKSKAQADSTARLAILALNDAKFAMALNKAAMDSLNVIIEQTQDEASQMKLMVLQAQMDSDNWKKTNYQVNAKNVTKVFYENSDQSVVGSFNLVDLKKKQWVEYNNEIYGGKKNFKEDQRDEWSLYLISIDDGVTVHIDLFNKKIIINDYIELYVITKMES